MKLYLFLFTSLTLVCEVFTRSIASQKDEDTCLHCTRKRIEHTKLVSSHTMKFYPQNMLNLREQTKDSWKYICKPPLQSLDEALPQCVKNPCRKDGWVPYSGICHALGTRGPCAPNRFLGVDKMTLKVECIPVLDDTNLLQRLQRHRILLPDSRRLINGKRSLRFPSIYNIIAQAPVIVRETYPPCPPGSFRNKVGMCRKPMLESF